MNPLKVIELIAAAQQAYHKAHYQSFDLYIKDLVKELKGITTEDIDVDALVHSFM